MQRETRDASADLSRLVGSEATVASTKGADLSASLARKVGGADHVDERGWRAPDAAQPARRPRSFARHAVRSVNAVNIAVAVIAIATLAGSAAVAVTQRVTSDPAAEAMVSLREREAELQNDSQVLATAVGLYKASLSDAAALADAAGGVLGELVGIVDQSGRAPAESARSSLTAAIASAPSIAVPDYERLAIRNGSVVDIAAAIDKVQAVKKDIAEAVSEARGARSKVVAALDSLQGALRGMDASIAAAAAEATRSHTAAADGFRSAVTDAAARVREAHQGGRDGVAEMSDFAAAVTALRAEDQRVLEQRRSGAGNPEVRVPSVPRGSTRNTTTETPPAADPNATPNPGGSSSNPGGETPSPDPTTSPAPDPTPDPSVPLPSP
ncbi:hypothetical protein [Microbacterium sp. SLBN-111]|uniref:hypothetical protein n=1 Tax=Microbacterium sp. SLBN-111 TaxID=3377733 RepID=UPI003C789694